jgi:hypothetical protein
MKKASTLAVFIFIALHSFSQVNQGMPGITEVFTRFFSTYAPPDTLRYIISFQKKAQGWYVAEYDGATSQHNPANLFWNKEAQQYNKLDYQLRDSADTTATEYIKRYLALNITEYIEYCYNRALYCGYTGWESDVIDAVENNPSASDTLLEALGYAYVSIGQQYCWGTVEAPFDDSDFVSFYSSKPISQTRIKKLVLYENKAIEIYKRLALQNSQYSTFWVGPSFSVANEKIDTWAELNYHGYEKEAQAFIKDVQPPDSMLQQARKILQEVKPNSILFVGGDNIINALRYLQYKGVRTDVTAICYEYLSYKGYVAYLDKKYNHRLFNISPRVYLNEAFYYTYLQDSEGGEKEVLLDSFLNRLYRDAISKTAQNSGGGDNATDNYYYFYTKKIYLNVNKSLASALYGTTKLKTRVYTPVSFNYLPFPGIVQFDIFQKNFCRRHIYFTAKPDDSEYLKCAIQHGPVWEFTPEVH